MNARFSFLLLSLAFLLLVPIPARATGADEDRMAGTAPHSAGEPAENKEKDSEDGGGKAPESAGDVASVKENTPPPSKRAKTDYIRLESAGLISHMGDGGLGIDLWDGSERAFVSWLIRSEPSAMRYRTLTDLTRRALMTKADTGLLKNEGEIEPGQDLLTLRIGKLSEMGSFSEAAKLYTGIPQDKPYHENLARTGILALLYDGQESLACLEARAFDGFRADPDFWATLDTVCDYILSKNGEKKDGAEKAESAAVSSKIVGQVLEKESFRLTLATTGDFTNLKPLEKALLTIDSRIDYSALKKAAWDKLAPLDVALLLNDSSLPEPIRFRLMTVAVRKGIRTDRHLTELYDSGKKDGDDAPQSLKHEPLAKLYQSAGDAGGKERISPVQQAMDMAGKTGITPLRPFAPLLVDIDPSALSAGAARTGMRVLIVTGTKPPKSWLDRWKAIRTESRTDLLIDIALDIASDFSTDISSDPVRLEKSVSSLPEAQKQLVLAIYKRLDTTQKLHNDADNGIYEKKLDLTFGSDYVMPSTSLIDTLEKAKSENRLGEVVLLSAMALHGVPSANMYAGLFDEVADGLSSVGLKKEARALAVELVLGLNG